MSESRPTLQYAAPLKRRRGRVHEIVDTSLYALAAVGMMVLGLIGLQWLRALIFFSFDASVIEFFTASIMSLGGFVWSIVFAWQVGAPLRHQSRDTINERDGGN